jgi:hypothetical protein
MAYRIDTMFESGRFTVVVSSAAEALAALTDLQARGHKDLCVESLHGPLDFQAMSDRDKSDDPPDDV